MTASPMEADIAASDPDEFVEVAFPAITDVDTDGPMKFQVKEFRPGQLITIVNKSKRRNVSEQDQAKNMAVVAQMVVSLVVDPEDRDFIETEMAVGKIDLDDLMEFLENIVEELAGRPTQPSSGSSRQRTASGPTSQARSVRRAKPSKNSG